jgi:hypothetical protein
VIAVVNPAASFQRQLVCQFGVVTASCSWVGPAWLTVMCDAGSRTATWMDRLNEFLSVAVARDAMWPQNGLAISQNKTTRTLIEFGSPSNW